MKRKKREPIGRTEKLVYLTAFVFLFIIYGMFAKAFGGVTNKAFSRYVVAPADDTVRIIDNAKDDTLTIWHDGTDWHWDGGNERIWLWGDTLLVGDTADDQDIVFYFRSSTDSGAIQYDVGTNKMQYSNDGGATWSDMGSGAGNAAITDSSITLLNATAWRLFYSNATATAIQELALGSDGTYLKSNGADQAPTWATPSGGSSLWDTLDNNDTIVFVGSVDTMIQITDSSGWTLIDPGDNTNMRIGRVGLTTSDSLLAYLLYQIAGDSTYYISTQAVSAGEHCLYYASVAAGPDSVYWGACTGGALNDSVLGVNEADLLYLGITDQATDVDTAGTDLAAALGTRADWIGGTFTGAVEGKFFDSDTSVAGSLLTTQYYVDSIIAEISNDTSNWNAAYGWGDWSGEGFLSAVSWGHIWDHFNTSYFDTTNAAGDTNIIVLLSDSCGGGAARAEVADNVTDADYGDVSVSSGVWTVEIGAGIWTPLDSGAALFKADTILEIKALNAITQILPGQNTTLVIGDTTGPTLIDSATIGGQYVDDPDSIMSKVEADATYLTGLNDSLLGVNEADLLYLGITDQAADADTTGTDLAAALATRADWIGGTFSGFVEGKFYDSDTTVAGSLLATRYYTITNIHDSSNVVRGEIMDAAFENPSFPSGANFYGAITQLNVIPRLTTLDKAFMAPPDHWLGEAAFPGCTTTIPWRVQHWEDTNFLKGDTMYLDSIPPLWGGGPCDSVRECEGYIDTMTDYSTAWGKYRDSSNGIHTATLASPEGWPHRTDSVTEYWDHGKRGYDSSRICWDGGCDSSRNLWVLPHKYWLAFTPLDAWPGIGYGVEMPHLVCSEDGINWTNQVGSQTRDTIRNPIFVPADFIIQQWYIYAWDTTGSGDTLWAAYDTDEFADSGLVDSQQWIEPQHLQDPDIFFGKDGNIWYAIGATYGMYYLGHSLSGSRYYAASSQNGIDWSNVTQITHLDVFNSPAFYLDTSGTYTAFYIDLNISAHDPIRGVRQAGHIYKMTADSPNCYWSESELTVSMWGNDTIMTGEVNFPWSMKPYPNCDSCRPWHIDITPRGANELIMVFTSQTGYGCTYANNYAFGIAQSIDGGDNWAVREEPIYSTKGAFPLYNRSGKWDTAIYRPSMYWLNDDMTIGRVYYSGSSFSTGTQNGWHMSYFDLYFNGNDSTYQIPLWNLAGYQGAPDNTVLWKDRNDGTGNRYLVIDSATASDAYDTLLLSGFVTQDMYADSLIIEMKTTSADPDSIILDSVAMLIPKVSAFIADSAHASSVNVDTSGTAVFRLALPWGHHFRSGQEAAVKFYVSIPNISEKFYLRYAALKGRKR